MVGPGGELWVVVRGMTLFLKINFGIHIGQKKILDCLKIENFL
jgi:hypothetical protein